MAFEYDVFGNEINSDDLIPKFIPKVDKRKGKRPVKPKEVREKVVITEAAHRFYDNRKEMLVRAKALEAIIRVKRLTKKKFAKMVGANYGWMCCVLRGEEGVSFENWDRWCKRLGAISTIVLIEPPMVEGTKKDEYDIEDEEQ